MTSRHNRPAKLGTVARRVYPAIATIALAAAGCGPDDGADDELHPLCERSPGLCDVEAAGGAPALGPPTVLAPSTLLPAEFVSQVAHNNLDAVWHDDRVWVAIRTAPSHFASPNTVLYVVSSPDLATWRFEGSFAIGTDIREPQFVSHSGRLWLYYAELGRNPLDFEPKGTHRHAYRGPGDWTDAERIFTPSTIVWRVKTIDGQLNAIGYAGGAGIYDGTTGSIDTHWWVSDDGETWRPRTGSSSIVRTSGGSETDLVFGRDGRVLAVSRNEQGDADGFGSHICTAPASDLFDWSCVSDPRKFDSPLMLGTAEDAWLIARRNVTETGHYDLGAAGGEPSTALQNQIDYWQRPKRCALWRVGEDRTVTHVLDLPSRGDTCFPEAIDLGGGRYLVFNYTSPLDGEDTSWVEGQGGPTWVYWAVLALPTAD